MQDKERILAVIQAYIARMPSLPVTVSKILQICNDPKTSPSDLNQVISLDPVLMGRVMKLINSAYYSLNNQITSLVRAIIMLGINTVKNLALSTAVLGNSGRQGQLPGPEHRRVLAPLSLRRGDGQAHRYPAASGQQGPGRVLRRRLAARHREDPVEQQALGGVHERHSSYGQGPLAAVPGGGAGDGGEPLRGGAPDHQELEPRVGNGRRGLLPSFHQPVSWRESRSRSSRSPRPTSSPTATRSGSRETAIRRSCRWKCSRSWASLWMTWSPWNRRRTRKSRRPRSS